MRISHGEIARLMEYEVGAHTLPAEYINACIKTWRRYEERVLSGGSVSGEISEFFCAFMAGYFAGCNEAVRLIDKARRSRGSAEA
jgi:hypothetical protein